MAFKHKSVLLDETIEGLNIKPDGIYVDGTLGGGGHAYEVCRRLNNKGSFIGIDQDAAAIEAAGTRLSDFGERVTIIRSNYCDMKSRLHEKGIDKVDGIVLDLGVSSYQLDTADRGFSYRVDAPLDMRMDTRQTLSAKEIVNGYSEMDLFRIIRDYGEDKFAKNIAMRNHFSYALFNKNSYSNASKIVQASIYYPLYHGSLSRSIIFSIRSRFLSECSISREYRYTSSTISSGVSSPSFFIHRAFHSS